MGKAQRRIALLVGGLWRAVLGRVGGGGVSEFRGLGFRVLRESFYSKGILLFLGGSVLASLTFVNPHLRSTFVESLQGLHSAVQYLGREIELLGGSLGSS